jgi:hypothetical protein
MTETQYQQTREMTEGIGKERIKEKKKECRERR